MLVFWQCFFGLPHILQMLCSARNSDSSLLEMIYNVIHKPMRVRFEEGGDDDDFGSVVPHFEWWQTLKFLCIVVE